MFLHLLSFPTPFFSTPFFFGQAEIPFFFTGKTSRESDVYSFGVVALEIACGRKPVVELNSDLGHVRLSQWVWSLYGIGQLFEAVDKDLTKEYDNVQVERLMSVGLWCCHPDSKLRLSIR